MQMAVFIAGMAPPPTADSVCLKPRSFAPRLVRLVAEPSVRKRAPPISRDRRNAPGVGKRREADPVTLPPCLTVLDGSASAIHGVPA